MSAGLKEILKVEKRDKMRAGSLVGAMVVSSVALTALTMVDMRDDLSVVLMVDAMENAKVEN